MGQRSRRSYVGSEGRIAPPLLDEIFERASELTASRQRELVDEVFAKAAEVQPQRKPSARLRARRALERLERVAQPGSNVASARAEEAAASHDVMGFSDRTPAQGVVPLGAHLPLPVPVEPTKISARVSKASSRAARAAARAAKASARIAKQRAKASQRTAQAKDPEAASPRAAKAKAKASGRAAKSKASARRRRARSSREARMEPISELPPLPTVPQALPALEADDFGFGFHGADEDHLAQLDLLVQSAEHGWAPRPPRAPRRDDELVCVGSESDDELAIL